MDNTDHSNMEHTSEDPTAIRIPRPKGATVKAMEGKTPQLYDIVGEAFMRGLFPYGVNDISMYEFASLYNIPPKHIERKIQSGLASDLISGEGNLAETLEKERLKLFSTNLFRIGNSDRVLNQLLVYLSRRVLSTSTAHPLLIKELNSSIGSQIRLTETSLKAIQMLNDALLSVVPESDMSQEDQLSREEILIELASIKADPTDFEKHLEGAPSLDPIDSGDRPRERLKEGSHSYIKKPKTKTIPMPHDIPILAQ